MTTWAKQKHQLKLPCHCEPQRGVAISWYCVQNGTWFQEIATSLRFSQ